MSTVLVTGPTVMLRLP